MHASTQQNSNLETWVIHSITMLIIKYSHNSTSMFMHWQIDLVYRFLKPHQHQVERFMASSEQEKFNTLDTLSSGAVRETLWCLFWTIVKREVYLCFIEWENKKKFSQEENPIKLSPFSEDSQQDKREIEDCKVLPASQKARPLWWRHFGKLIYNWTKRCEISWCLGWSSSAKLHPNNQKIFFGEISSS